jgi:hypothetical protein
MKYTLLIFVFLGFPVLVFSQNGERLFGGKEIILTLSPIIIAVEGFENMPFEISNNHSSTLIGASSYNIGSQISLKLSKKLSSGLLTEIAYSFGKAGVKNSVLNLHVTPQINYQISKRLSTYIGLTNKFNVDEWIDTGNEWQSAKKMGLSAKVDLRTYSPYELRGKIGIRAMLSKYIFTHVTHRVCFVSKSLTFARWKQL